MATGKEKNNKKMVSKRSKRLGRVEPDFVTGKQRNKIIKKVRKTPKKNSSEIK